MLAELSTGSETKDVFLWEPHPGVFAGIEDATGTREPSAFDKVMVAHLKKLMKQKMAQS